MPQAPEMLVRVTCVRCQDAAGLSSVRANVLNCFTTPFTLKQWVLWALRLMILIYFQIPAGV